MNSELVGCRLAARTTTARPVVQRILFVVHCNKKRPLFICTAAADAECAPNVCILTVLTVLTALCSTLQYVAKEVRSNVLVTIMSLG